MVSETLTLRLLAQKELAIYAGSNPQDCYINVLGALWHAPITISINKLPSHLSQDIKEYLPSLARRHEHFMDARKSLLHFLAARQNPNCPNPGYNCVSMLVNGIFDAEPEDLFAMWENRQKDILYASHAKGDKIADVTFDPKLLQRLEISYRTQ